MPELTESQFRERSRGILLGTALGDAMGFATEGLTRQRIAKRYGKVTRFHVLGTHGFVTDDTEQSALVAQCLCRNPTDSTACMEEFRKALLCWFLCMPFGVGRATIKACTRFAFGCKTGVKSAGNGAAMRAAIVGLFFHNDAELRLRFGTEFAQATHCDTRAVEGALFVAELAAACAVRTEKLSLHACFDQAIRVVSEPELRQALEKSAALASTPTVELTQAVETLNQQPIAYIVNSLPFSTFSFLRYGESDVLTCLSETIAGGGDTDSNAAIVGAWLGALKGGENLPADLIGAIDDGPFGPKHLTALADALVDARYGRSCHVPRYSLLHSWLRNVCLVPILLVHVVLRLIR